MNVKPENLECYLEAAVSLAKEAGKAMLDGFHSMKIVDTKTASWDLVTQYDKDVEHTLIKGLKSKFASHKIIGEETVSETKTNPELTDEPTWIIDPIDGTTNFVHGFQLTCISIGLTIKKEVVVGVVYNPILNEMFTASKGGGAYLNNKQIHASKTKELSQSLFAMEISFVRNPKFGARVMKRAEALVSTVQGFRSLGSAALTLCYVALGSIDGYHIDGLQSWDVAGGSLIIQEAGGVVLNTDGSPFDIMAQKLVCAGTKELAEEVVQLIKKADAQ